MDSNSSYILGFSCPSSLSTLAQRVFPHPVEGVFERVVVKGVVEGRVQLAQKIPAQNIVPPQIMKT